MRIVIDLQGAQTESRLRGIGRYSLALATAMARNNRGHEILVALNGLFPETIEPIIGSFRGLLPPKNFKIWTATPSLNSVQAANSWRRNAAEIIREEFLHSLRPDFVHISSVMEGFADDAVHSIGKTPYPMRVAATFYDAIPLIQRKVYLDPHPTFSAAYLEKLGELKRADLLLAISESARGEAMTYLGMPEDRVVNVSAAVDAQFVPTQIDAATKAELGRRFGFRDGFVMYSGAADERKNHRRLIEAYSMLPSSLRTRYPLLIVGGFPAQVRDGFAEYARSLALDGSEVIFTGRVLDTELVALCNLCTLFVLPSWHEGFGLPALEAMSCGTAAIGSNTSSVPEVIGRGDALFDPHSARDIAQKIEEVLCNESFRDELAAHGLMHAKTFSWDKSAGLALDAFEKLVDDSAKSRHDDSNSTAPETRVASIVNEIARSSQGQGFSNDDLLRVSEAIAFNVAPDERRNFYIDISTIVHVDAKSGIQRVVRSLLHELIRNPPAGHSLVPVYFESGRYRKVDIASLVEGGGAQYIATSEVVDFRSGDTYLALDLNAHLSSATHNLHVKMRQLGVRLYFVVYDILIMHRPDWWARDIAPMFEKWLRSIAEVATGLVCISATVAEDVSQWLGAQSGRRSDGPLVGSFHLGADIENSRPSTGLPPDAADFLAKIRSSNSFLMVGTLEPRKGHAQALAAFELLWRQGSDAHLVIVGKKGWLVDELHATLLAHPQLGNKLHVLTGASDEYLEMIYGAATCLLVASEGEGFGLPLIEAAQRGVPLLARDLPVFREVAGTHAHYFHGLSAQALADAITAWLALHKAGEHPSSESMPWITWRQSAQQLCRVIECWAEQLNEGMPGPGARDRAQEEHGSLAAPR